MNVHNSSGFVIRNSQISNVGGHQITVHRYGSISTNEMNEVEPVTELISDRVDSIPRLSRIEVPLIDQPGIPVRYGRDVLFHARLRKVFPHGGWALGGSGEDETRVVVRRLAKESSDEDVNQEIRHSLTYYYPYVMQLFGASRVNSPTKFLVYSNSNLTTYIDFIKSKHLEGEGYRSYDVQYDLSFNSACDYLKTDVSVDGFTLDIIFSEIRTVGTHGGSALIMVPTLPSSPVDRAKLIIKVLEEFQHKINRRIDVAKSKQFTRCPECLATTSGWNQGLINSVLRCLTNAEPHLEWGRFLIQSGSGHYTQLPYQEDHDQDRDQVERRRDEFDIAFEKANTLIEHLRENAESELNRAMNDVVIRSNLASSGICSWCGKRWEREETPASPAFEDSSAVITIVEDTPVDSKMESSRFSAYLANLVCGASYRIRIVMVVICILLAGGLAFIQEVVNF